MTETDVLTLEGDELLDLCRELAVLGNRVAAIQTLVTGKIWKDSQRGEIDSSEQEPLARRHGCRNAVELVQRITGESARVVNGRFRLARTVGTDVSLVGETIPAQQEHVAVALTTGRLSPESAQLISTMLAKHTSFEVAEHREMAERCLVQAATGLDFEVGDEPQLPMHADDIRMLCKRWDDALDPDGSAPDDEQRMDRRYLNLGRPDNGLVRVNGLITMEVAAALMAAKDALSNPHRPAATDGRDADGVETASGAGRNFEEEAKADLCQRVDLRTAGQLRHDAFETVLRVALAAKGLPTLGGAHTTVVVEVQEEALRRGTGSAWLLDHEGERSAISVASVKNMSCGASIQTVVRNSLGRIKQLGTPMRTFNAHQRRTIALRDQQCVIPGCTVPASWCEVHHVVPHSHGGATHTDNGVLLCTFHHRTIDTGGWEITMQDGVPSIGAPGWLGTFYPEAKQPYLHKMKPRYADPPDLWAA